MWGLVLWPGPRFEPGPPAELGAWSLSPWTTREVTCILKCCPAEQKWDQWFPTFFFVAIKRDVSLPCVFSCVWLFCDCVDCSPSDSSVHGISQAKILEWIAISFCKGSSWTRDWTWVSCMAGRSFTAWPIRKAPVFLALPAKWMSANTSLTLTWYQTYPSAPNKLCTTFSQEKLPSGSKSPPTLPPSSPQAF